MNPYLYGQMPHFHPILFRVQHVDPAAALTLAAGLLAVGQAVHLLWGLSADPGPLPADVVLTPLPPASVTPSGLLLDATGAMADPAWKKRRAAATLAAFAASRPPLILLDGASPLFGFELRPLLAMAHRRTPRPRVLLWPNAAGVGADLAPLIDGVAAGVEDVLVV